MNFANVGSTDRILRILAGLVLAAYAFYAQGGFNTTIGLILMAVGAVLIVTALISFCPLYGILGLRTRPKA